MTTSDTTPVVRVLRAAGTDAIAAAVQQATTFAAVGQCVVVAGLVFISTHSPRKPHAWQFSLSHWGREPVVVSVHRYKRDAEEQVVRVQLMSRKRDLRDDAAFAALVEALAAYGDGEGA